MGQEPAVLGGAITAGHAECPEVVLVAAAPRLCAVSSADGSQHHALCSAWVDQMDLLSFLTPAIPGLSAKGKPYIPLLHRCGGWKVSVCTNLLGWRNHGCDSRRNAESPGGAMTLGPEG